MNGEILIRILDTSQFVGTSSDYGGQNIKNRQTETYKLSRRGRKPTNEKKNPTNVMYSVALSWRFSRLGTKLDNWKIWPRVIFYLYSQSNMKVIGNTASKIHVSPKLNLNYKCCRRFRLLLNHMFTENLHDVAPYNSPYMRSKLPLRVRFLND